MSKASMLIVEDEAIVAADLASKLCRLGYRVTGSTGFAEEALALAREELPDLVLMDIRLAGPMDGIEAAEQLRREFDVPVIFLTAHSDRSTLDRAKGSDPFGYLLKPFHQLSLETHIEMALYKHQAERRLRQAHEELEARVQERTRELREAETELRKMNETLEQRVAQRTAELEAANALLRESRQAAESASRTKSLFLANMSHELRTPMTGVLGMLELALQSPMEPQQRDYLETAHRSGRSLLRILNDILDLTKVEAGVLSLEHKPFDLPACVRGAVEILIPEARRKGLLLDLVVADDLPRCVVGDQLRLRQVLTNLIGNAVKFTDQGRVEVEVKGRGETAAGRASALFSVRDTGIGIPEQKRDILFKSFSQVDDSHTRSHGGTGLGLAISSEIVQRMGARIGFESEAGKGSVFSFEVSLEVAEPGCDQAVAVAAAPVLLSTAQAPRKPERVTRLLVAEDDATIRQVLGGMLRRFSFEVEFAEDGEEAVEMWRAGDYDVVVMDVQMPRLDGFQATQAIRELELARGGRVPIIAMTAHAMKEDEQRCLDAGMDAYVSKPVDFRICLAKIKELADRGGAR